jgi:hypothetical protein
MNRIARTVARTVATGTVLTAASLVLMAGPASAGDIAPAPQPTSSPSEIAQPEPQDPGDPAPGPSKGPGEIAQPEPEPTKGPDDLAQPEDGDGPKGPEDLSAGESDPQVPDDKAGPQGDGVDPQGPDDLVNDAGCVFTHGCPDDGDSENGTGSGGGSVDTTGEQTVRADSLPFTGDRTATLGLTGAGLLAAGAAALVATRRRTASATR